MHAMMFLSGMGALVFEVVWFTQMGLLVGNSVWSAALVVSAFMAGLALGNALAVRLAKRWFNLVRGYGALEAIAALSGATVVVALPWLPALFRPLLGPLLEHAAALNSLRMVLAFALMVVPATALGTSLPLLSRPLEQASGSYGFALGSLYGINTLGAVAGTVLAELVLVPVLGLRGSGVFAAACNLGAAALALATASRFALGEPSAVARQEREISPRSMTRVVAAAFLAGGVLLALEVVWFRLLLLVQTGTTVMFAVMLAVVLAGVALGGMVGAAWARAGWHPATAARLAAAGAIVALVLGYAGFHGFYSRVGVAISYDSVAQLALLSLFLMGPVCVFSGMLFTALGDHLRGGGAEGATATGILTFANTLGGMAGSLLAAFALLPGLGIEASLFGLALVYGLVVVLVPGAGKPWPSRLAPVAAALAALAAFPLGNMRSVYYPSVEKRFGGHLVAAREGMVETAFYLEHDFLGEPLDYQLVTNSYSMSGTASHGLRYMRLFAYLPAAFHPRIEDALVICFGVGVTAAAVEQLPDLKRVDIVDVSRDILDMSDIVYRDPRRHPLLDRRASVHLEDGRFFLQQTSRRYDLITGEPPPPKVAGVAALYTREFFGLMREHLKPGGVATYWLSVNELFATDALAVIGAFCDVFTDCSLWHGVSTQWLLMGSRDGMRPVPGPAFSRLWRVPATRNDLLGIGVDTPAHMLAQFMADASQLKQITAAVPSLIDDFPRRLSPQRRAGPLDGVFAWLLQADRSRERLDASQWLTLIAPAEVLAAAAPRFRERGMLDEELFPYLRRPDHSYWDNVAFLLRQPGLLTWKLWMLNSEPRKVEIAKAKDPTQPLVAEQLLIEALATGRRPERTAPAREEFVAMTPKAQVLTAFRYCLAGDRNRAREVMGWFPRENGGTEPYRRFLAWANRGCPGSAPSLQH